MRVDGGEAERERAQPCTRVFVCVRERKRERGNALAAGAEERRGYHETDHGQEEREPSYEFSSRGGPTQEMRIVSLGWPLRRPSQPKPGERSWPGSLPLRPSYSLSSLSLLSLLLAAPLASPYSSPPPPTPPPPPPPPPRGIFILSVLCALLLRRAKMVHGRS